MSGNNQMRKLRSSKRRGGRFSRPTWPLRKISAENPVVICGGTPSGAKMRDLAQRLPQPSLLLISYNGNLDKNKNLKNLLNRKETSTVPIWGSLFNFFFELT